MNDRMEAQLHEPAAARAKLAPDRARLHAVHACLPIANVALDGKMTEFTEG